jgi:hypothetical protein
MNTLQILFIGLALDIDAFETEKWVDRYGDNNIYVLSSSYDNSNQLLGLMHEQRN